ncbi:MAG: hypothetical protein JNM80_15510 [Phycisphaerae bacterium]|nr:hypothetical protein [Phycisphaerae bacterium]
MPNSLYTQVSSGWEHSLAIRSDATLIAWGSNQFGQTTIPAALQGKKVRAISAGYYHSLVIIHHLGHSDDGTVVAWGRNQFGECIIPSGLVGQAVVSIAAAELWSVAVRASDGKIFAWGQSATCGDNEPPCPNVAPCVATNPPPWGPTNLRLSDSENLGFVRVSATGHFGMAQRATGGLHVWGADDQCQVTHAYLDDVLWFSAGHRHALVIRPGSGGGAEYFHWGHNGWGQRTPTPIACPTNCEPCFGTSCYKPPPSPFPQPPSLSLIKGGYYHSIGQLADGSLFAWGKNYATSVCDVPAGTFYDYSSNYDTGLAIERLNETDSFANADRDAVSPRFSLADIMAFQQRYGRGEEATDCNGDEVLDYRDILCFLRRHSRARLLVEHGTVTP